ncbi:Rossmann-like and DUF2520 domain-containing protein [Eubacterium oxidoreducens]|uniref:Predicted oxidoreductase, contains short-chain dehydrogenase (SDR) and DUF2520 domains n=1 Tax=Eubacterium oxidoreducens TaxID=1732 RepID=A0A1G6BHE6_EUBOX|nr:Rossmann-like and DUF2520 domain-containing protein [Eubacterium oxidoreducens]SDB20019.1 Predicted oxidoreductase, contains short-chain dehydrogenase (SDR) and DUF2520 domains [Eubacterium oxidoreducens]
MDIGIIGAGKVGCTLGKYWSEQNNRIIGYYDTKEDAAAWAASFTHSKIYRTIKELVADSEVVLITVPDGLIESVWQEVKTCSIQEKCILHCSGSISSKVFEGALSLGGYPASIHPLYAVSDKKSTYLSIKDAAFSVEGNPKAVAVIKDIFANCSNPLLTFDTNKKTLYHTAAATASNLVVGLLSMAQEMMEECGFDKEEALKAMAPLIIGNVEAVIERGPQAALTGPIERNDLITVEKHLSQLSQEQKKIYKSVSNQVINVAQKKHPDRDYHAMRELLQKD